MKTNKSLLLFATFILAVAMLAIERDWAAPLNLLLYDHQVKTLGGKSSDDVVIVAIDNASLHAIGEWPWSRAFHGEAIDLLVASGAKAIAYNLVFSHARQDDVAGDLALKQALMLNRVVLPVYIQLNDATQKYAQVLPHPMFAKNALLGHVNMLLDGDGVARTIYLDEGIGANTWPHFSQQLLNLSQGKINSLLTTQKAPFAAEYTQQQRRYIPYMGDTGSFQQVSFLQLLTGKISPDFFKDKIVLVGVTATSLGDPLSTPHTSDGKTMSAVEVNANIFQALRDRRMIQPVPMAVNLAVVLLILLSLLILVPRLSGFAQLFVVLLYCAGTYFLSHVLLHSFNYWLPIGVLILALMAIVPLWNALRYHRFLNFMVGESRQLKGNRQQGLFASLEMNSAREFENRLLALMNILQVHSFQLQRDAQVIALHSQEIDPDTFATQKDYSVTIFNHQYRLEIFLIQLGEEEQGVLRLINQTFERVRQVKPRPSSTYDILIDQMAYFKELQQESLKTQALFQSAINEMGGGLLVADEFGYLIFHNQQAAHMLNIHPKGASVFNLLDQLSLKERGVSWLTLVRQVLIGGSSVQIQASSHRYPDLDVSLNTMSAIDSRQTLLLVNIANIEKIKQAQRIRNETIDFLSHDMRAPMSSLLALSQRQRQHNDIAPQEFLNQVEEYARTNLHYAEQFLQLARVESSEPIAMYELDMGALVQNALDSLYHQAMARGIQFSFDEPDDAWVSGNGEILERVMVNLLTNAVKYGQANSRVLVAIRDQGDAFKISVQNSGPAIGEGLQQNLFKPYQRASQGTHKKQQGVGLGLRFVAVSLQRHDTNIDFYSDDQHTCFYFHLKKLPMSLNSVSLQDSGESVKAAVPLA